MAPLADPAWPRGTRRPSGPAATAAARAATCPGDVPRKKKKKWRKPWKTAWKNRQKARENMETLEILLENPRKFFGDGNYG